MEVNRTSQNFAISVIKLYLIICLHCVCAVYTDDPIYTKNQSVKAP
jgi:hypothetical protein